MSFAKSMLGFRKFSNESDILNRVRKSKNYNSETEVMENAKSLLIFQTSKQQTWLVSTSQRLYCILDDIRKPEPKVQWSISKNDLGTSTTYKEYISVRPKSDNTGLLDIGQAHRGWLYSKRLFTRNDILESVVQLLINA